MNRASSLSVTTSSDWKWIVRQVLLDDGSDDAGDVMEFRLTYSGQLLSIQGDPQSGQPLKKSQRDNKYALRRHFHFQLRQLWATVPFLHAGAPDNPTFLVIESSREERKYDRDTLAHRHQRGGFSWVPLVTKDLKLLCSLDVLMLRTDLLGSAVWRGDVDNRLKMLIDALKLPDDNEDYSSRQVLPEEKPMYVLMEDDRLLTKVSVETDHLLDVPPSVDHVQLVITVRIRVSG